MFRVSPGHFRPIFRLFLCVGLTISTADVSVLFAASAKSEAPEILATRPAISGHPGEVLLSETTTKTADLWFTPEGPKKNVNVGYVYRYYMKIGEAVPRELKFLKTSDTEGDGFINRAFPMANSNQWIGVRNLRYWELDYRDEIVAGRPHNLAIGRYEVVVFSTEKLIRRTKLEAVAYAARFSYLPETQELRFWRNDGWWRLDPVSGRERPEPDRRSEQAPGNHGLTIPGSSAQIVFELPAFSSSKEFIGEDRYSFEGETGIGDWQAVGIKSIFVRIQYGWHWKRDVRTRDQLVKEYFDHPPGDLPRTAQYIRVERVSPARSEYGWAKSKQISYLSDMDGWPVEISLFISAPYERWADVIARFEGTLRIEGESGRR